MDYFPKGSKTFRWDEWIWFGLVPATSTLYILLYLETRSYKKFFKKRTDKDN